MTTEEWKKLDKRVGRLFSVPGSKTTNERQIGRATGYTPRGVTVAWERTVKGNLPIDRWTSPEIQYWPYQCVEVVK